jgi:hypothetical protein
MSELDQRAKGILETALKLPPKRGVVYLDRACVSDAQLHQRIVEPLFKAQEDAAINRNDRNLWGDWVHDAVESFKVPRAPDIGEK